MAVYLLLLVGEIFISIDLITDILDFSPIAVQLEAQGVDKENYKKRLIVAVVVSYCIYLVFFFIANLLFLAFIYKFNTSMQSFHFFLATYRQTPRSRFIRKYKPSLEPLYEENSAFEKSILSSHFLDTSKGNVEHTSHNHTRNISI